MITINAICLEELDFSIILMHFAMVWFLEIYTCRS